MLGCKHNFKIINKILEAEVFGGYIGSAAGW